MTNEMMTALDKALPAIARRARLKSLDGGKPKPFVGPLPPNIERLDTRAPIRKLVIGFTIASTFAACSPNVETSYAHKPKLAIEKVVKPPRPFRTRLA
jgi:hypothetical protein